MPMMNSTIDRTGGRVEAIAVKQKTAEGYSDEIGIPTQMVPLGSRPPRNRNVGTNRLIVVVPIRTMTNFAGESAVVNFWKEAP